MFNDFGFRVVDEEKNNMRIEDTTYYSRYPYFETRLLNILFINFFDSGYADFYYNRNFARTIKIAKDDLQRLFPKSYKETNAGLEYSKMFYDINTTAA